MEPPAPPGNSCATLSTGNAPLGPQPARDSGANGGRAAPVGDTRSARWRPGCGKRQVTQGNVAVIDSR